MIPLFGKHDNNTLTTDEPVLPLNAEHCKQQATSSESKVFGLCRKLFVSVNFERNFE